MSSETSAGTLTVVATPIGNLGDLSPRAVETLQTSDHLCCEDTRRSRALLTAVGITGAGSRLTSLHAHNEESRVPKVLEWLARGDSVALVSDAGTPGLSDPGARLVAAVAAAGHQVTTVPGPSAALAALVVSGLRMDRFCVEGFLPRRGGSRQRRLRQLLEDERTSVVFEAPGRLASLLADLADLADLTEPAGGRRVVVARELTKLHEEVWRGTLDEAARRFSDRRQVMGEVVVVVEGATTSRPPLDDGALEAAVRRRLAAGEAPSSAAAAAAAELGVTRREAYDEALRWRGSRAEPGGAPDAAGEA